MFDEQTSGSIRARASWTAAAMTPLFPGATGRPAQSAARSAHSKYLSGHPVNKSALFCAICDLLPSPNITRVMGITYKFRIGKNAQNFSSKTSWRSSTCENPPQVNKGNWTQKNSEFFLGNSYRKTLVNQRKIVQKTLQNHAKKSRFLMRFFHHHFINKSQTTSTINHQPSTTLRAVDSGLWTQPAIKNVFAFPRKIPVVKPYGLMKMKNEKNNQRRETRLRTTRSWNAS